jgi:hypothetical protein
MSGDMTMTASGARFSVRHFVLAVYGVVVLALVVHFLLYLRYALTAVVFPFEVDYGEGIVWQQALLIPGKLMYGDITRFPFIVFHYPPLYHLAVHAADVLGFDALLVGRGLSLVCTLLTAGLVGALSYDVSGPPAGRTAGLVGSAIAGLTVFCYWPVVCWSPLLRVDMLAVMLSFLGVWLAGRQRLRLAVLVFVLAVYTKQTSITAPLAVLFVAFSTDRRAAWRAYGLGLLLGLSLLLVLTWLTDGGFIRHLLFYNLNRFSLATAAASVFDEWPQALFLALALGGLVAGWRGETRDSRRLAVLTLWLVLATAMLATLGKSGAKLNYMIDWMCIWSVLIGILITSVLGSLLASEPTSVWSSRSVTALLVPVALLAQVSVMPTARDYYGTDPEQRRQLVALTARLETISGPVLSDDMVLLLKAGKPVPWEPAIFAELASTGRWDEHRILDMIKAHAFACVITRGHAGDEMYDSRFTPSVDQAIQDAYPRTEQEAGRTLRFPPAS